MLLKDLQNSKTFQQCIKLFSTDKEIVNAIINPKFEIYLIGLLLSYLLSIYHIGIQVGKYGYSVYYASDDMSKHKLPFTVRNHTAIIHIGTEYQNDTFMYYKDALIYIFKQLDNGS